jgi:hypothetical protein
MLLFASFQNIFKLNKLFSVNHEMPMNITCADMQNIRMQHNKWVLLQELRSPSLNTIEKIKLIQMYSLFDELNQNIITSPNVTKGLEIW